MNDGGRGGVRVGVLGPTELVVDGQPVPVSRVKVRALLTVLAAEPGRWFTHDELIDALWSGSMPADPKASLAVVTSRLRSLMGSHRAVIESTESALRLLAQVDVDAFHAGVRSAQEASEPSVSVGLIDGALGLWRGAPLQGLDEVDSVRRAVSRLHEAHTTAVALLVESLLAIGDVDRAVLEGVPAHEADPLAERLAAASARALVAAGRRSDALEVLDRTRRALRDGLGLDPGALLTDLEGDIVRGVVDVAPSRPTAASSLSFGFVARETELQLLADRPRTFIVRGEQGIGKTALLHRLAETFIDRGLDVVTVTASATPTRPMDAIADLVAHLDAHHPADPTDEMLGSALARMNGVEMPGLRRSLTRDALVSSIGDHIARSCPSTRTVIVVDDAHWLDPLSALVVERLCADERCAVVVGTRPDPVHHVQVLSERHPVLELGPLDRDDIAALARLALGQLADRFDIELVWSRTGGNPLFATLLLDMVREGQRLDDELPTAVRVVVQQRLAALSQRSLELVRLASVIGTVVEVHVLHAFVPTDSALTEAIDSGVLCRSDRPDTVEFAHSLLAEVAYASIAEGSRVALHDRVGELLSSIGAGSVEIARHFEMAAALDPERAARAHLAAAQELAEVYDWEDVETHALQGLDHVDALYDEAGARLAVLLGRSQRLLHRAHPDDALVSAAEFARAKGDHRLFAEAVGALAVQGWSTSDGTSDEARSLYDEALALDLPDADRARLCAVGATLMMSSRHEQARSVYREAVDVSARLNDDDLRSEVLRYSRWGFIHPEDLSHLAAATDELAARAGDDVDLRWGAAGNRFCLATIAADLPAARAAVDELLDVHDRFPGAPRIFEATHLQLGLHLLEGRADDAEALLDDVLRLGLATTSQVWVIPIYLAASVGTRRAQGRMAELVPLVRAGLAERGDFVGWRVVAAAVAAASGDVEWARRELEIATRNEFGAVIPDATWTTVMMLLADACLAVGDLDRCRRIAGFLEPYADRMSWSGVSTCGPIAATLADLHTALGDPAAASRHAETAAAVTSRLGW